MKKLCLLMALLFVLLTGCEGAAAGSSAASVGSAASGGNAPVEETAPDAEEDPAEAPISVEETSGAEEFAAELVRRENLSYPLTEEQVTLSMFCAAPTLGPLPFMGGDYGYRDPLRLPVSPWTLQMSAAWRVLRSLPCTLLLAI